MKHAKLILKLITNERQRRARGYVVARVKLAEKSAAYKERKAAEEDAGGLGSMFDRGVTTKDIDFVATRKQWMVETDEAVVEFAEAFMEKEYEPRVDIYAAGDPPVGIPSATWSLDLLDMDWSVFADARGAREDFRKHVTAAFEIIAGEKVSVVFNDEYHDDEGTHE